VIASFPDTWLDSPDPMAFPYADPSEPHNSQTIRTRTVRLGQLATLEFEDAQTLWFRMQELTLLARHVPNDTLSRQLEWYSQLLPVKNRLLAAVWLTQAGNRRTNTSLLKDEIVQSSVVLQSDSGERIEGRFLPQVIRDRTINMVGWLTFEFTELQKVAFLHSSSPWTIEMVTARTEIAAIVPDEVMINLSRELRRQTSR
jgi:hypothetical protein